MKTGRGKFAVGKIVEHEKESYEILKYIYLGVTGL